MISIFIILFSCFVVFVFTFYVMEFHDTLLRMDKTHTMIKNDMNCDNYQHWLHYDEGVFLDMNSDIREKAKEIGETCK